ncbi:MAG: S-adenosylmethionine-dependent methyltransferase [Thelocarpon impressellum]|nr:MAG: S-adenosylmethionine-dependent methyltransferase [Thelocarpon impressellum]
MFPTPSTSHVSFANVYEPAEDSYLLLDTLSSASETAFLVDRFGPARAHDSSTHHGTVATASPLVLEVGSGSGVVLAFVAAHARTIFGREDVLALGTDVHAFACQATRDTVGLALAGGGANGSAAFLDPVVADLAGCVRAGTVDILVFNPPYVPTESLPAILADYRPGEGEGSFERDSRLLALSYAGGVDGMETTERLLYQLPTLLSRDRGVAYVLLCAQNNPNEVVRRIDGWGKGWRVEMVGSSGRKAGWEKLRVVRIWRWLGTS